MGTKNRDNNKILGIRLYVLTSAPLKWICGFNDFYL